MHLCITNSVLKHHGKEIIENMFLHAVTLKWYLLKKIIWLTKILTAYTWELIIFMIHTIRDIGRLMWIHIMNMEMLREWEKLIMGFQILGFFISVLLWSLAECSNVFFKDYLFATNFLSFISVGILLVVTGLSIVRSIKLLLFNGSKDNKQSKFICTKQYLITVYFILFSVLFYISNVLAFAT